MQQYFILEIEVPFLKIIVRVILKFEFNNLIDKTLVRLVSVILEKTEFPTKFSFFQTVNFPLQIKNFAM